MYSYSRKCSTTNDCLCVRMNLPDLSKPGRTPAGVITPWLRPALAVVRGDAITLADPREYALTTTQGWCPASPKPLVSSGIHQTSPNCNLGATNRCIPASSCDKSHRNLLKSLISVSRSSDTTHRSRHALKEHALHYIKEIIAADFQNPDVFFHITDVDDPELVEIGAGVSFDVQETPKGLRAKRIRFAKLAGKLEQAD